MKPTLAPHGNCLQACITTLFNLKPEDVPDFGKMSHDPIESGSEFAVWYFELQAFLNHRGYALVILKLTEHTPLYPVPWRPMVLMIGTTAEGTRHAVIGEIGGLVKDASGNDITELTMTWNPYPEAEITGVQELWLIVPMDPAKLFQKIVLPKIEIVQRSKQ